MNKKLAVSRAFGDFTFKKETTGKDIVTVEPDVIFSIYSLMKLIIFNR